MVMSQIWTESLPCSNSLRKTSNLQSCDCKTLLPLCLFDETINDFQKITFEQYVQYAVYTTHPTESFPFRHILISNLSTSLRRPLKLLQCLRRARRGPRGPCRAGPPHRRHIHHMKRVTTTAATANRTPASTPRSQAARPRLRRTRITARPAHPQWCTIRTHSKSLYRQRPHNARRPALRTIRARHVALMLAACLGRRLQCLHKMTLHAHLACGVGRSWARGTHKG